MTGPDADILPGNCLPIANIPVGEMIHNIELYPGKGAQLVRAAGVAAQLMAKENGMAQVRLPSGEVPLYPRELQGHHRPGGQHRLGQHPDRQGRPQAPHGLAAHRPRLRHEPQ